MNRPASLLILASHNGAGRALAVFDAVQGREASLNGATQVRAGALRPEIIVSHAETNSLDLHPESSLEVGRKVRLIRVPYFGLIATVTELPHAPEKIETGSMARVLKAQLENGEIITVPRANVELI